jgi:hypothetical protein
MLLRFLLDFSDTPKLRGLFAVDPDRVIADYGLGADVIAAWKSGDRDEMIRLVSAEAIALLEAPPGIHVQMPWWTPVKPDVRSIDRARCELDKKAEFLIQGGLFLKGATVSFVSPSAVVHASVRSVHDQSKIVATATFDTAGVYDVVVRNPHSEDEGVLPRGLQLVS